MDNTNTKYIAQFITVLGSQIVVFLTIIFAVIQGNWIAGILLNIFAGIVVLFCVFTLVTEVFLQYSNLVDIRVFRVATPTQQEPKTVVKFARTHIGSVFSIFEIAIFYYYGFWGYLVLWLVTEYAQYIQRKNISLAEDCA
ncbi:hypothetical protein ACFL3W_00110 [Pseudomonadota bacterium]